MNNSVFTEQDNLARSADEPFPTVLRARSTSLAQGEFLHSTANRVGNSDIVVSSEGNSPRLYEGMAQIVQ